MGIERSSLGRACAATAVIASSVLLGLPGSATAASNEGSVSGTIQDGTGQPLQDICVNVGDTSFSSTNATGDFSIPNVPVGTYQIEFTDCSGSPSYVSQWYEGATEERDAQFVTVANGQDSGLNTVTMQAGTSISGNVAADGSGDPIQNVSVNVDPTGGGPSGWAQTDSNGDYETRPLADGDYTVQFSDGRHASEYYDNQYRRQDATTIRLNAADGKSHTGVNAQLADGATISGTVEDNSNAGIEGICVNVQLNDPHGDGIGWAKTRADGTYEVSGLPEATVYVSFDDCSTSRRYLDEWYQNQHNADDAAPLDLVAGMTTPFIDATLDEGAAVSGTVTDEFGQPLSEVSVSFNDDENDAHGWARTDGAGEYTAVVEPGNYRVRFENENGSHATEFWNNRPTYDDADLLVVADTNPITGINAQLEPGAQISGTVTDPHGARAANICVGALYGNGGDPTWLSGDETDAAGKYTLSQLPAGPYRVYFQDCNNTGPYLDQFYDGTTRFPDAQVIDLAIGGQHNGVDVQMVEASEIGGTVKNTSGSPLEGICVQVVTPNTVVDMTHTRSDGSYSIRLAAASDYRIQFVDCGNPDEEPPIPGGTYQATWYGGGADPSSAQDVALAEGEARSDIDAFLETAAGTGTLSGTVKNVRGDALQSAVVVLYLPTDSVRFRPVGSNGKYSFSDVPTGTYAIGFLGQGGDDPVPFIPDAGDSGVSFSAKWYKDTLLSLPEDSAPDPIAQGATLVTVSAGDNINASMCFGCGSVQVEQPTIGDDYILVDFADTGLSPGSNQRANTRASALDTLTYRVVCNSDSGKSTSASQDSYPVRVSGFTPGAPYACSAHVLSNDLEVASSATFEVTVGKAIPATPTADSTPGTSANPTATPSAVDVPAGPSADKGAGTPGTSPAKLAYTGGNIAALVALGLFMALIGLGVVLTTMRVSTNQERRRATS